MKPPLKKEGYSWKERITSLALGYFLANSLRSLRATDKSLSKFVPVKYITGFNL